jgi:hypothetical protein
MVRLTGPVFTSETEMGMGLQGPILQHKVAKEGLMDNRLYWTGVLALVTVVFSWGTVRAASFDGIRGVAGRIDGELLSPTGDRRDIPIDPQ